MKTLLILLLNSILVSSLYASSERVYMAPIEKSQWTLGKDTILKCEIEHDIPKLGKAIFYQESGRKIKFKILTDQRYNKNLEVSFRSVTANWKGVQSGAVIAKLKTTGVNPLIRIENDSARQGFYELQQGYHLNFTFVDDEDGHNAVSIIVSTVNFREIEKKFSHCVMNLYPYHFDDIKNALVYFDFDAEFPEVEVEEKALNNMLEYLKIDSSVKTVTVTGHTDYKGRLCYNDTLSERRALYVYDYLLQSGVEPRKLSLEFKGETDPAINKKDDVSRAFNRRVEINLSK